MKYKTTMKQTGNNTGIPVPPDVLEALDAGKRPRVAVTVNGYTYHTTVGSMDGQPMLSFSAAHREASGLQGGDVLDVEIKVDTAPVMIEIPDDLAAALKAGGVTAAFDSSAPSMKKEYVRQVTSARQAETRQRRIPKVVEKLKA